ncbi:hypothetical protein Phum_PHUM035180 [Pediculus humanus corporis]|uniref:Uncharacterized protein n=1 Tax=Pediculus humanus subsp. corporis TaxID=121224 RepID=E0VAC7_PEDHC|nr:uncharacterized protein Phum_PHUM035180 [Pediculus humanus corporis]EEB10333.1 hypothetical protein Phum_PHUM035180 [Pediculus humanus corporis]
MSEKNKHEIKSMLRIKSSENVLLNDDENINDIYVKNEPKQNIHLKSDMIIVNKVNKNKKLHKRKMFLKKNSSVMSSSFDKIHRKIRRKKNCKRKSYTVNEKKPLNYSKKFQFKTNFSLEKVVEVPEKGKRGRLGGKAMEKPPHETKMENFESDDESDNEYYSRISLGHFQHLGNYDNEASTSNQSNQNYVTSMSLATLEDHSNDNSEEKELKELQEWGRSSSLVYSVEINKQSTEKNF